MLEMGAFYAKQLRTLLNAPSYPRAYSLDTPDETFQQWHQEEVQAHVEQLSKNRERAFALIVEMLRYQDWRTGGRS